ncbi:MAG: hypothetical protein ACRDOC_05415 [Streptosporangiaceae bacterium]
MTRIDGDARVRLRPLGPDDQDEFIAQARASTELPGKPPPHPARPLRPTAAAKRTESPDSLRSNALDPGFHGVLTGPEHKDRDADGAGVAESGFWDVPPEGQPT